VDTSLTLMVTALAMFERPLKDQIVRECRPKEGPDLAGNLPG
jgi:hypothetical protein